MAGLNHKGMIKRAITYGSSADNWDAFFGPRSSADRGCQATVLALIAKHCDGHRLRSPDQLNDEGDGILAFKGRCGLRVYFWQCTSRDGEQLCVVGLVIHKKKRGLDANDHAKVVALRNQFVQSELGR